MPNWEIILIVTCLWTAGGLWMWTILKVGSDADDRAEEMRRELQGERQDWPL